VLLLAFDTATPAVTVALHDGDRVIAEAVTVDARRHGELLSPSIAKVIADAGVTRHDITAVAVGAGPGPYTSLRAGVVTARVLGAALALPVYGVCTLDVIARGALAGGVGRAFLVATDARRKEVYWARYSGSGDRLSGPAVGKPADVRADGLPGPVAGEGGFLYPAELGEPIQPRYPDAGMLAHIAAERVRGGTPMLAPEPLYLRRPDARVPGPPKRVTPS